MKRIKFVLKIWALLSCVFLLSTCTIHPDHTSNSILLVTSITGHTDGGNSADFLESDVFEDVDLTYVSDIITATLEAKLKEPESIGLGSSYQNRINIHSYDVSYTYVDSNIDPVPSPNTPTTFTGRLSEQIDIDASLEVTFVVVRAQAKTEAPLLNVSGLDIMQVVARITFYGEDISGNPIQATGYLTIYFANYTDV
jgi:hypothetical protein